MEMKGWGGGGEGRGRGEGRTGRCRWARRSRWGGREAEGGTRASRPLHTEGREQGIREDVRKRELPLRCL